MWEWTTMRTTRTQVTLVVLLALFAASCVHLDRVTVDATGAQFSFDIEFEDVSYDGRFVVLKTQGAIDPLDTNTINDIYRKDTLTGDLELMSIDSAATEATGGFDAAISDDGDRVVFIGDSGRVVLRTVSTGTTTVVGLDDLGNEVTTNFSPDISGDGNIVAWSTTSAVVGGTSNGFGQVYRRNLTTGVVLLASAGPGGDLGNGSSSVPTLSQDGLEMAFLSSATNLVANDVNGVTDVFARVGAAPVARISTSSLGVAANGESYWPMMAGNGKSVVFESSATNLDPEVTFASRSIYRKQISGELTLASRFPDGTAIDDGSNQNPSVSHDGSIVSFVSGSDELNFYIHAGGLYVRDLDNGTTTRGSALADGTLSWVANTRYFGHVSGDGNYALWNNGPGNAWTVPGDDNSALDVLMRWWSEPNPVSMSPSSLPVGVSTTVTISGSGFRTGVDTVVATNLANVGADGIFFSDIVVVDDSTITATIDVVFGEAVEGEFYVTVQQQGTGPGSNAGSTGSCLCISVT